MDAAYAASRTLTQKGVRCPRPGEHGGALIAVIPRRAPGARAVTWRTAAGGGGKSVKFEMTCSTIIVSSKPYKLNVKVRQDGHGNTLGALLCSIIITGKSAVITPGQGEGSYAQLPPDQPRTFPFDFSCGHRSRQGIGR